MSVEQYMNKMSKQALRQDKQKTKRRKHLLALGRLKYKPPPPPTMENVLERAAREKKKFDQLMEHFQKNRAALGVREGDPLKYKIFYEKPTNREDLRLALEKGFAKKVRVELFARMCTEKPLPNIHHDHFDGVDLVVAHGKGYPIYTEEQIERTKELEALTPAFEDRARVLAKIRIIQDWWPKFFATYMTKLSPKHPKASRTELAAHTATHLRNFGHVIPSARVLTIDTYYKTNIMLEQAIACHLREFRLLHTCSVDPLNRDFLIESVIRVLNNRRLPEGDAARNVKAEIEKAGKGMEAYTGKLDVFLAGQRRSWQRQKAKAALSWHGELRRQRLKELYFKKKARMAPVMEKVNPDKVSVVQLDGFGTYFPHLLHNFPRDHPAWPTMYETARSISINASYPYAVKERFVKRERDHLLTVDVGYIKRHYAEIGLNTNLLENPSVLTMDPDMRLKWDKFLRGHFLRYINDNFTANEWGRIAEKIIMPMPPHKWLKLVEHVQHSDGEGSDRSSRPEDFLPWYWKEIPVKEDTEPPKTKAKK